MKKLLLVYAVFALLAPSVMAEEIGLSVGLDIGIDNFNEKNGSDMHPWVEPFIRYEKSFLKGALDLYAKIADTIALKKSNADNFNQQELYFDLVLKNNIFLNPATTLSFIVENEIERFKVTNRVAGEAGMISTVKPGFAFKYEADSASVFHFTMAVPIMYTVDDKSLPRLTSFETAFGWVSPIGLGFWAKEIVLLTPTFTHHEINLGVLFTHGPFHMEVEVDFLNQIVLDAITLKKGIVITPKVEFTFADRFVGLVQCEIIGINADYDTMISPSVGLRVFF